MSTKSFTNQRIEGDSMDKKSSLLLGAHMSIAGGFHKAFDRAESIECTSIQIFTKSNRQWSAKPITPSEIAAFKDRWRQSSVQSVIAHAAYLINIGSSNEELQQKSVAALTVELERCKELGIPYLVLHPGIATNSIDECLETISHNLDLVFKNVPGKTMILLENTAGQGSSVGYTLEHLAKIYDKTNQKNRLGFCLDTCHAFAAGYDLRTEHDYNAFWKKFDVILGIKNLYAIHINDSKKGLDSRVDRHEHIGLGKLGLEPFRLLFNDPRFYSVIKVLETPYEELKDYIPDLTIIKDLLTDETKNMLNINE